MPKAKKKIDNPITKRVGYNFRRLRKARKLTQEKLAEIAGVGTSYIGQIETAAINLGTVGMAKWAELLGADISEFYRPVPRGSKLREEEDIHRVSSMRHLAIAEETAYLDVFHLAGAGSPKSLAEYEPIETLSLPVSFAGPNIVPVKIKGRSMEPVIWDGAIVGIDRSDKQVVSGELYAVWIPYEGAVVKRLFIQSDKVIIRSDNPHFPEEIKLIKELENTGHGENFILGRVRWILQKL